MHLVLQPMPQPADGGICVGLLDDAPCTFHGRVATVGGGEIEAKAIAAEILVAVENAARALFGPEWVQSLALVSGLNVRTCQRDRIGRYGLPAPVLRALGEGAAFPWARALGDVMLATARLAKTVAGDGGRPRKPGEIGLPPVIDTDDQMAKTVAEAKRVVTWLAQQRAEHRAPAIEDE
ncbi:hypothetical protein MKK55_18120 [Methylobacterium sp. J-059]|jgi:hypothetical protein|uniref:hypothetical protein n=1 Tax=Methylobacterium sp. J-059 TaxID=2836643 RepID=UPI001FB89D50|nr:hypothetical protein [Methylobacterium sp. J-059]MCJ2040849.1 hypothetical protein [Methylobacterium sp. J-059]